MVDYNYTTILAAHKVRRFINYPSVSSRTSGQPKKVNTYRNEYTTGSGATSMFDLLLEDMASCDMATDVSMHCAEAAATLLLSVGFALLDDSCRSSRWSLWRCSRRRLRLSTSDVSRFRPRSRCQFGRLTMFDGSFGVDGPDVVCGFVVASLPPATLAFDRESERRRFAF